MSIKPDAQQCQIREQIFEDPASGLTFQFERMPNGETQMRVYGDLPLGNREIVFDQDGKKTGGGTALTGLCKPTWSQPLDR